MRCRGLLWLLGLRCCLRAWSSSLAPPAAVSAGRHQLRRTCRQRTPAECRAGLHAAAGQAGQGDRAQPHPQHSEYCRIDLGHRLPVAAAGSRGWAGLEGWAQRISGRDGFRGWSFSPRTSSSATLAGLPLDWLGHHYERATASACRDGEAGLATRRRRWDWRLCSARRCCCSSTGLCGAGRGATGLGSGWSRCRSWCFSIFVSSLLLEPIFDKFEPLSKSNPALVHRTGEGGGAHRDQYSA